MLLPALEAVATHPLVDDAGALGAYLCRQAHRLALRHRRGLPLRGRFAAEPCQREMQLIRIFGRTPGRTKPEYGEHEGRHVVDSIRNCDARI